MRAWYPFLGLSGVFALCAACTTYGALSPDAGAEPQSDAGSDTAPPPPDASADAGLDATPAAPEAGPANLLVFVTSSRTTGNMGNPSTPPTPFGKADLFCAQEAENAGLGKRHFVALLAARNDAGASDIQRRVAGQVGPRHLPGPAAERSIADITNISPTDFGPIHRHADGGLALEVPVWTGHGHMPPIDCDHWRSNTDGKGGVGLATRNGEEGLKGPQTHPCAEQAALYCVEVDPTTSR